MDILLVRHAESANNLLFTLTQDQYNKTRSIDPDLSPKGVIQAQLCAQYFKRLPFKPLKIYCSPQLRGIKTANIIGQELALKCEIKINIHEQGGCYEEEGCLKGNNRKWFQEHYPNFEIDSGITDEGWYLKESKENKEQAWERAKMVQEQFKQWEKGCYIVVSHGNFMDLLIKRFTKCDLNNQMYYFHQNTGITYLHFGEDGLNQFKFFNNYTHLLEKDDKTILTSIPMKYKL